MNKIFPSVSDSELLVFVTIANHGMVRLTDNLIRSIRDVGMVNDIVVGCMDELAFRHYKKDKRVVALELTGLPAWPGFETGVRYTNIGTRTFSNMMLWKYLAVERVLKETSRDVAYVDGDIAFWRSINDYFSLDHIQDVDLFCSVEPPISPGHYCCGFFYYKNCEVVLDFVKYFIGRVTDRYREADYSDDQLIFNELVSQKDPNLLIKIGDLPEEQFCNGHYLKTAGRWTKDGKIKNGVVTNNMYMAHANWMVGDKAKVNFLKKLGLYQSENWWSWLVDSPLSPGYWQQWRWNRSN